MKYRSSSESDLLTVRTLLEKEGLPINDIDEHLNNIIIAEEDGGEIVGIGALEMYGEVGLFRSLVVKKRKRNKNTGARILKHIEEYAKNNGIKELYLLTENATRYFKKQKFEEVSRDHVPNEIKCTKQFSSLCPASAVVMRKDLYVE
jgi:amino-acid N-acetyltransferase